MATRIKKRGESDALKRLRELRNDLEKSLMTNPDFVALRGIERAIAEFDSSGSTVRAGNANASAGGSTLRTAIRSQADAVWAILDNRGEPLPTSDLVRLVRAMGISVTGKAEVNLSSALSKDDRFNSVRHKGKPCWWLAARAYIPAAD